jgi:hypothetical protein
VAAVGVLVGPDAQPARAMLISNADEASIGHFPSLIISISLLERDERTCAVLPDGSQSRLVAMTDRQLTCVNPADCGLSSACPGFAPGD